MENNLVVKEIINRFENIETTITMRVLFVTSANKKKRVSPFILSQAESLVNNGVEVDFFTLEEGGLKGYIKYAGKLRKYLKSNKYDLIHAHYALCGFISTYARKKEKLVVSLMGCDILGSYRSDGSLIWREQIIVIFSKLFARFIWDFTVLKSANMIQKLLTNTRYAVIPNGVDLSLFQPMDKQECRRKLNLNPERKYILFPTNPNREEKNFPLAKKAYELVKKRYPEPVELLIVHNLTYKELVVYYNAVDLCIMTSRSEGSPNVIKECMACNLPIVSTDVGDVKEIISNTDGCYISSSNPEEFAEKIILALNFDKRTTGRNDVSRLEINAISKRIVELYKNEINN